MTLSVDNLLDTDPPFTYLQFGYQPFGSVDAYGRIVKLAIQKKW